ASARSPGKTPARSTTATSSAVTGKSYRIEWWGRLVTCQAEAGSKPAPPRRGAVALRPPLIQELHEGMKSNPRSCCRVFPAAWEVCDVVFTSPGPPRRVVPFPCAAPRGVVSPPMRRVRLPAGPWFGLPPAIHGTSFQPPDLAGLHGSRAAPDRAAGSGAADAGNDCRRPLLAAGPGAGPSGGANGPSVARLCLPRLGLRCGPVFDRRFPGGNDPGGQRVHRCLPAAGGRPGRLPSRARGTHHAHRNRASGRGGRGGGGRKQVGLAEPLPSPRRRLLPSRGRLH